MSNLLKVADVVRLAEVAGMAVLLKVVGLGETVRNITNQTAPCAAFSIPG